MNDRFKRIVFTSTYMILWVVAYVAMNTLFACIQYLPLIQTFGLAYVVQQLVSVLLPPMCLAVCALAYGLYGRHIAKHDKVSSLDFMHLAGYFLAFCGIAFLVVRMGQAHTGIIMFWDLVLYIFFIILSIYSALLFKN